MDETQQNGRPWSAAANHTEKKVNPSSVEAIAEEIATYKARRLEMAAEHEGEFVLIKGTEIGGFFPDDSSATREGYRRFGFVPFLVKQVAATERVIYIPNVVL